MSSGRKVKDTTCLIGNSDNEPGNGKRKGLHIPGIVTLFRKTPSGKIKLNDDNAEEIRTHVDNSKNVSAPALSSSVPAVISIPAPSIRPLSSSLKSTGKKANATADSHFSPRKSSP